MSKNSEKVKRWREKTKQRIVDSLGGCCQICKYDKCINALELHHLNSDEKDFGLGSIRANIKSWDKIVQELRKCVLLCANCHREYHSGLLFIPDNVCRFDEKYADYNNLEMPKNMQNRCKQCGILKPKFNNFCSLVCSGKYYQKIDWDSIDLLALLKEHRTLKNTAEYLNISDKTIYRRMKKLGITKEMI